jgi:hypothetical protein
MSKTTFILIILIFCLSNESKSQDSLIQFDNYQKIVFEMKDSLIYQLSFKKSLFYTKAVASTSENDYCIFKLDKDFYPKKVVDVKGRAKVVYRRKAGLKKSLKLYTDSKLIAEYYYSPPFGFPLQMNKSKVEFPKDLLSMGFMSFLNNKIGLKRFEWQKFSLQLKQLGIELP